MRWSDINVNACALNAAISFCFFFSSSAMIGWKTIYVFFPGVKNVSLWLCKLLIWIAGFLMKISPGELLSLYLFIYLFISVCQGSCDYQDAIQLMRKKNPNEGASFNLKLHFRINSCMRRPSNCVCVYTISCKIFL